MVFVVAQGAFSNGVGGMDGSAMLTADEQAWTDNAFPFAFIPYVKAALVCRRRQVAEFNLTPPRIVIAALLVAALPAG
jgi:hypothetical protein